MVQAARSGRQNIAEGSMTSATSKKSELKLTNVAKAGLEELLLDYQDFLRQRGMPIWDKASPEAMAARRDLKNGRWNPEAVKTATAAASTNTMICLSDVCLGLSNVAMATKPDVGTAGWHYKVVPCGLARQRGSSSAKGAPTGRCTGPLAMSIGSATVYCGSGLFRGGNPWPNSTALRSYLAW